MLLEGRDNASFTSVPSVSLVQVWLCRAYMEKSLGSSLCIKAVTRKLV